MDEEETIKRVARSMFGNNLEFTPQVMDLIKGLYRKFLEDMKERAA